MKERRHLKLTQVARQLREDFKKEYWMSWYIFKGLVAKRLKSSDPEFKKLTTLKVIEESINWTLKNHCTQGKT